MLEARRISAWRGRYRVSVDGRPVTVWDGGIWKKGGRFELDGRRYEVRGNLWGTRYDLLNEVGLPVASADRVGRKRWTVEAGGRTYHFRRTSMLGNTHELRTAAGPAGMVKRTSMWRGDLTADLPGLPLPVQIFVIGVVIAIWEAQNAAAGAAAAG